MHLLCSGIPCSCSGEVSGHGEAAPPEDSFVPPSDDELPGFEESGHGESGHGELPPFRRLSAWERPVKRRLVVVPTCSQAPPPAKKEYECRR